jgi:hypothetical protein
MKQWEGVVRMLHFANGAVTMMQRPSYRCTVCGGGMGFYRALSNNIFKVEKMPEGGLLFYDGDLGVTKLLDRSSR